MWPKLPKKELGNWGEQQAANYLLDRGYCILGRNLKIDRGEFDLVALDPDKQTLVMVEVKTRSTATLQSPLSSISWKQWRSHLWSINKFGKSHGFSGGVRLDIISVLPNQVMHLQNVTWP